MENFVELSPTDNFMKRNRKIVDLPFHSRASRCEYQFLYEKNYSSIKYRFFCKRLALHFLLIDDVFQVKTLKRAEKLRKTHTDFIRFLGKFIHNNFLFCRWYWNTNLKIIFDHKIQFLEKLNIYLRGWLLFYISFSVFYFVNMGVGVVILDWILN